MNSQEELSEGVQSCFSGSKRASCPVDPWNHMWNFKWQSAKERTLFSFVRVHMSRCCDFLGGEAALSFLYRSWAPIPSACKMAFLQPARERKEGAVRWMAPCHLSLHFPADRPENTPWRKRASFPPGAHGGCPQNLSAERELQGACSWVPCCPPCLLSLPFSSWQGAGRGFVSRATFPFFWLVLFFSGTFSSKFSIYSQYFYCFLSFSSPVFSLCLSSSFFPISHFHLLTSKEQKQL